MEIRKLCIIDSDEYQKLILQGVENHPESFRISVEDVRQSLPPFVEAGEDDFTLGAFDNDVLIGVVSFEREKREKLKHKGLIYRMYVAVNQSGKGTGRKLLQSAIEEIQTIKGLEQINLTVVATNERAQQLYQNAGFTAFSLEQKAIKNGTSYFDEQSMTLQLPLN